ncbi:hypothetical protein RJ639_011209 [Escallonia herrerae]|uniref:Integrase catalytic domain-containing protein n=1 Tax=Escallonia herrerae TaxID=1293975 RepID=A0AA88VPQ9_9ASTE|nr:hypothetical protein RJ639_011209 [Escallonia herrerae]
MLLLQVSDAVMCRAFPIILRKAAQAWFKSLQPRSIYSFGQLSDPFQKHFVSSRSRRKNLASLLNIVQEKNESLACFLGRFNAATLEIDNLDESMKYTAFLRGLRSTSKFAFSVNKSPQGNMKALLEKANKYIQLKNTWRHRGRRGEGKEEQKKRSRELTPQGGKSAKRSKRDERRPKDLFPLENLTPLNAKPSQILHKIKDNKALQWPDKMRSRSNKRNKDLWCHFHNDHGHITDNCGSLKLAIEALIKRGQLRKFVAHKEGRQQTPLSMEEREDREENAGMINTISGGLAAGGIIALPVAIGTPPTQANFMLDFVEVKVPSAYNAILGRPSLNRLQAVVSTNHLKIKFSTEYEIGEVKGDQTTAPADMPGIDPEVITHRLTIDPSKKPVKQKKRTFAPERQEKIEEQCTLPEDPPQLVIFEVTDPWNLYVDGSSAVGGSGARIILISLEGFTIETSAVKFENFNIQQIPLDQNTQADTLSRLASAEVTDVRRSVYLEFLKDRSISSQTEIGMIDQELCWMDMIIKYLSTDYFIKWTEAESLATITSAKCEDLFWKSVVCHFGVPRALVVDNRKQFDNNNFRTFCTNLSIDLRFTSVAHPQSNGQTENMNRSILQGLKKKLDEAKGAWVDELPKVLWAYRTTPHSVTGETPFLLCYGTEAMLPVEIGVPTIRTLHFNEGNKKVELRANLDLVEEARTKAHERFKDLPREDGKLQHHLQGITVSPDGDTTAGIMKSSKGMSGKRSANISFAFVKPIS